MSKVLSPKLFREWKAIVDFHLQALNERWTLGYNASYYELGYRGKNHRIVLLRDGIPIAAGMVNITKTLMTLRNLKHFYEGVK